MKKNGFTLIEILVALATLGIVLTVIVSVFLTVLTKSAKVKIVKAVENDGNYALRVMGRMIRNSKGIVQNSDRQTCQSGMNYLRIENPDGNWSEFACLEEGLETGFIASSSASGDKRLTSPQVKLDNCQFDCSPGGVEEPDRVTIFFTLKQSGPGLRVEERASIDFKTAITLRNY